MTSAAAALSPAPLPARVKNGDMAPMFAVGHFPRQWCLLTQHSLAEVLADGYFAVYAKTMEMGDVIQATFSPRPLPRLEGVDPRFYKHEPVAFRTLFLVVVDKHPISDRPGRAHWGVKVRPMMESLPAVGDG